MRCDGGAAANLHWFACAVEDSAPDTTYDLVVAGDSVHWFDWAVVMPRLARASSPSATLAIVTREWFRQPSVRQELAPIYSRYGANRDFRPLDPVVELQRRGLIHDVREHRIGPVSWRPRMAEILRCHHSQNGFDTERMTAAHVRDFDVAIARAFDDLVAAGTIAEHGGRYDLDVAALVSCCTFVDVSRESA